MSRSGRNSVLCVTLIILACASLAQAFKHQAKHTVEAERPTGVSWRICETIPEGMDLKTEWSTYEVWNYLVDTAEERIQIGAFYMDFFNGSRYLDAEGEVGVVMYNSLIKAAQRGVQIQIAVQQDGNGTPYSPDAHLLSDLGYAEVRYVNWNMIGDGGILHTKTIITDNKNAYIGSANIAWDSLTQVKELGVVVENSPIVAADAQKIWNMYWYMGDPNNTALPKQWPPSFDTVYNQANPMEIGTHSDPFSVFISTDPKQLATPERTLDIDAFTTTIGEADEYVYGEVMDYSPTTLYENPNYYWDTLDTAFRAAPFNKAGVHVKLLFGVWNHTYCQAYPYLQSLSTLKNVTVRLFRVPDLDIPVQIPYTRVAHAKYIVTDKRALVSTSNWSADYFITTGGMSWNIWNDDLREQLTGYFERDWNSKYAEDICVGDDCDFGNCSDYPLNSTPDWRRL